MENCLGPLQCLATLRRFLALFAVLSSNAFTPVHAENCSDALDPRLKAFMESTNSDSASSSFANWACSKEGKTWVKANNRNTNVNFLGSFKLDAGHNEDEVDRGSSTSESCTQTQQSFSTSQLAILRQEVATSDQWKAYQTCILTKYGGKLIIGALEANDPVDWHPVTLKLGFNRSSTAIPTAIVTSMNVYGAEPSYVDWTGKKVTEDLTQILVRQPNKALTVAISTTLGSYTESLKAMKDAPTVSVHEPYCDPCAHEMVPPDGPFCLGRFAQHWAYQLASHGLPAEDADGLPVRFRVRKLMAQCEKLAIEGTLTLPYPPSQPNETQVNYQQRTDQLRRRAESRLRQVQTDIADFDHKLTNQGDRWFQEEGYQASDPASFCRSHPLACGWEHPRFFVR